MNIVKCTTYKSAYNCDAYCYIIEYRLETNFTRLQPSTSSVSRDDQFVTGVEGSPSTAALLDLSDIPAAPSYTLPSDNESEAETETVVNLQSFSKEEIFQKFRATERSAVKYRNKYKQV